MMTPTATTGASPRGRGSRLAIRHRGAPQGCIPAWAGEPTIRRRAAPRRRVHPRVGGGAGFGGERGSLGRGASPRGRGSPVADPSGPAGRGCIPAWAGEPREEATRRLPVWVHPRVGGGATVRRRPPERLRGASPRGRGSHFERGHQGVMRGCIPAWAGEPPPSEVKNASGRVHPRVGGGASKCGPRNW